MGRSVLCALSITLGGSVGVLVGHAFGGDLVLNGQHESPPSEFRIPLDGTVKHVDGKNGMITIEVFDHFRQRRDYLISTEHASLYASELARGATERNAPSRKIGIADLSEGDVITLAVISRPGPLYAHTIFIYPGQKKRTL